MIKFAFVIPIDLPRHVKYLKNLESLISIWSDVFLVLTDDVSATFLYPGMKMIPIILSKEVSQEALNIAVANQSIVTFKKWIGLHYIEKNLQERQYKYLICCDSEIRVIKPIDQDFVDSLPSQFNFLGNHAHNDSARDIIEAAKVYKISSPEHYGCNYNIVAWWSGLPIYDVESLRKFLNFICIEDQVGLAKSLHYCVFDHLVYQNFMVRNKLANSKFICFTHDLNYPSGGSIEFIKPNYELIENYKKAGVKLLWARYKLCLEDTFNVYILFHMNEE